MKNITILNAYGNKNIGDAAILGVAQEFIESTLKERATIYVFMENEDYKIMSSKKGNKIVSLQLPYGYAIRSKHNKISYLKKITRFLGIYITSIYYLLKSILLASKLPKSGFYSYMEVIKNSDAVISMGGGYLISQNKLSDYFGLLLTLLPLYIAKLFHKKILFLPISFGPFASNSHRDLCFKALRGSLVMCRDNITYSELKTLDKNKEIELLFLPDLALFFKSDKLKTKNINDEKYITLTARKWLDEKRQKIFETYLSNFIEFAYAKYKYKTYFIPMAWNMIEDNDYEVANSIQNKLNNKDIFIIKRISKPKEAQIIIQNAVASICTRMHSAILSFTARTPFILLGYGHKGLGFMQLINLNDWYLNMGEVNDKNLQKIFSKLINGKNNFNFIKTINREALVIDTYRPILIKLITRHIYSNSL